MKGIIKQAMVSHSKVRKALELFFESQGLPKNTPHVILAGGSMHLQGIPRAFNDIDVFVPAMKVSDHEGFYNGFEVDAHNKLFDPAFSNKVLRNRVHKNGLQMMSLNDVLEMKLKLNRPKDQKDIKTLRRILGSR